MRTDEKTRAEMLLQSVGKHGRLCFLYLGILEEDLVVCDAYSSGTCYNAAAISYHVLFHIITVKKTMNPMLRLSGFFVRNIRRDPPFTNQEGYADDEYHSRDQPEVGIGY